MHASPRLPQLLEGRRIRGTLRPHSRVPRCAGDGRLRPRARAPQVPPHQCDLPQVGVRRGVGVVGEQPVIFPRTGFEYSSACPLNTPNGRMEGDFEMKHVDKPGSSTFNVTIAPFSLSILGDGNDVLL